MSRWSACASISCSTASRAGRMASMYWSTFGAVIPGIGRSLRNRISRLHDQHFRGYATGFQFFLESFRRAGERGKSGIVHGNHGLGLEQSTGISGFFRAHGKEITDRQHAQVRRIEFPDDGHVAKNAGIAGMIKLEAVFEFNDKAAGLAARNRRATVIDGVGMMSIDHADFYIAHLLR